ncbi:MAG: energy transducer TonB [bacterium]
MKKILVLVVMIFCILSLHAQPENYPKIQDYGAILKSVKYPERALKLGIEGKVYVGVFIDSLGVAVKTKIMESKNPIFDQAAIDAVMQYNGYTAAREDGVSVGCWLGIPISFKIRDNGSRSDDSWIDIDYNADELRQNVLNAQNEYKYFNNAHVKTEVQVDKEGNITKILPFDTYDYIIDVIVTKAIQNTKFVPATYCGKNMEGFINLYINLATPTENFEFDFDGQPYTMNVKKVEPHSFKYYADLQAGTGQKIKNMDTVKIQCSVFDYQQKLKSSEEFKSILGIGEINQYLEQYIVKMQTGGEKLVWLTDYSMYRKGKKLFPKDLLVPTEENVYIKIKVLEINPK